MNKREIKSKKALYHYKMTKNCEIVILAIFTGIGAGVISKLADIYTQEIGNFLSQTSAWIMICVIISVFSKSPFMGAIRTGCFALAMVAGYYITAAATESIYSFSYVLGWTFFAMLTPIMSYIAWYSAGNNFKSYSLIMLILVILVIVAVGLYDRIRIWDMAAAAVMVIFIGVSRKMRRKKNFDEGDRSVEGI